MGHRTERAAGPGFTLCRAGLAWAVWRPVRLTIGIRIPSHEEASVTLDPADRMLANDGEGFVWELFHEN